MRQALLFFTLLIFTFSASSQIKTRKLSKNEFRKVKGASVEGEVPVIKMESFDISELEKEDRQRAKDGKPLRFAKSFKVNINTNNSGSWFDVEDARIWKLRIESTNAFSISLRFDLFKLSENATLYIYNEEKDILVGPITAENNRQNSRLSTDVIEGQTLTLELIEPKGTKVPSKIRISNVVHGYRNIFQESYGDSGSCNIDVECPLGNGWEEETEAIAWILLNGSTQLCTGSLLNNTCQDFTPLFLTAFHCLDQNSNGVLSSSEIQDAEQNWVLRFKWKSPSCNGSNSYAYSTYNLDSDLLASWKETDFALFELDQRPENASYLGWDRRDRIPNPVTIIHHPAGDVMKISQDSDNPQAVQFFSTPNSHFFVDDWDQGSTTGGSSGAPYFDENKRVIGQNHAGDGLQDCDPNKGSYFGRLWRSWDGGGTSSTRLRDWLDPGNTSLSTINTVSMDHNYLVCGNTTFNLNGLPGNVSVNWSVSPTSAFGNDYGTGNSFTTWPSSGYTSASGTVTAQINDNCGGQETITFDVWSGRPKSVTGNLSGPSTVDKNNMYWYSVSEQSHPSGSFDWSAPNAFDVSANGDGYNSVRYWVRDRAVSGYVQVSRKNACGNGGAKSKYVTVNSGGGGGIIQMVVSPNPTREQVNISVSSQDGLEKYFEDSANELQVSIVSISGKEVYRGSMNTNGVNIDLTQLPKGLYVVSVKGNGVEEQSLLAVDD